MNFDKIDWHPHALEEVESALDWYGQRSDSAAPALLDELIQSLNAIADHPERYARIMKNCRRRILVSFPFMIIYRTINGRIRVVAVAHTAKRANYWQDRL